MLKRLKKTMMLCLASCMLLGSLTMNQTAAAQEQDMSAVTSGENQDGYARYAQKPNNLSGQGYDVVFCVDNSGSIWSQQTIRDNALRSIANLAVGSDIKIGGVYFGDQIYKNQSLTSMDNKDGSQLIMSGFLNTQEKDENNRATNMGNALEAAIALFENQNADRNRIVILFSDGINEDVKGSKAYKDAADAKTKEQVKVLESKGIPVYCVYLQKERNDEAYLRDLVNYFNSENSYDDERFKKVTNDEISLLSKQFAEIFYDMQNNMKYREISFDSTGKIGFYVPSVGINKIQLYLNNPERIEASLENKENNLGIKEHWNDGDSAYVSLEDPVTGDWYLTLKGDNASATQGTIAYYADLNAYVEFQKDGVTIRPESDGTAALRKNDEVQAVLHFYDINGAEIDMDSAVQVEAYLTCMDDDNEVYVKPLSVRNENGRCISDSFVIEEYGTYTIDVKVMYEDFLNLEYKMLAGNAIKGAPVALHQDGAFYSEKTEAGQLFTFKTEELFYDPEGEVTTVVSINQIDQSNPVSYEEKDGVFYVYAKDTGDVNFAILVQDASGLTATVNVEGKVVNKFMVELVKIMIGLILLCVIILLIRRKIKNKNLLKDIQKKKTLLLDDSNILLKKYKTQETVNADRVDEEEYKYIMNSVEAVLMKLSEKENALYELNRFKGEADTIPEYVQWTKAADEITKVVNHLQVIHDDVEGISGTVADKKVLKRLREYEGKLKTYEDELPVKAAKCETAANVLDAYLDDADELYAEIDKMLNTPITCDLLVQWGNYMAAQKGRLGKNRYLKGSYAFDDMMVSDVDRIMPFREMFSDRLTNITVYGYQGEQGEEGLEFRRTEPFDVKKDGESSCDTVTRAYLLKNERYCIIIPGHGRMNITVR